MTPSVDEATLLRIDQALTRLLMRSYRAHTYERLVRATGLDIDQALIPVLLILDTLGPTRVSDAAEAAGIVPSTMSRHTTQLEARGLLFRHADPDDGRSTLVSLTGDGVAATERVVAEIRRSYADILDEWTPDEVRAFSDLFVRFSSSIAAGAPSASRSAV